MSDKYVVKIQTDMSGQAIYIYDKNRDVDVQFRGSEAKRVVDGYDMGPLEKIFVNAEVDENGMLHLHDAIGDQGW